MYIFGGNTNLTPEQIAQRREMADALMGRAAAPQNVGEGIFSAASSIASGLMRRGANKADKKNREAYESGPRAALMNALMGRRERASEGASAGSAPMGRNEAMAAYGGPTNAATAAMEGGVASALPASLVKSESGGNLRARNNVRGAGGHIGHFGRGQFGVARLQDAKRAGVIPAEMTPDAFMESPEAQAAVEQWHVNDIRGFIQNEGLDRVIGQTVGGVTMTPDGMLAMAHLGGKGGLKRFIETNGGYNPADANGTSLRDYAQMHQGGGQPQGQGVQVAQAGGMQGEQIVGAMEVLNSPYASEADKAMAQMILQRAQPMSEMDRLQLERERLELEQLRDPRPEPTAQDLPPEVVAQLGLPEGTVAQRGPDGGIEIIYEPQAPEAATPTSNMREYEMAVQQGFQGSFMDYRQAMAEAGRAQTNVNVSTGSEIGTIPQGYELITDLETGARSMRPVAGGPVAAESEANASSVIARADESIRVIDSILKNPSLPSVVGKFQGRLDPEGFTGLAMSQDGVNLVTEMQQLEGQAFLSAFDTLKGGGQITEREGQAATRAIANLSRLQDEGAYTKSLGYLRTLLENAKRRTGGEDVPEFLPDNGEPNAGGTPASGGTPPSAYQSREAFVSDPAIQQAAREAGVTAEEMWDVYRGGQ